MCRVCVSVCVRYRYTPYTAYSRKYNNNNNVLIWRVHADCRAHNMAVHRHFVLCIGMYNIQYTYMTWVPGPARHVIQVPRYTIIIVVDH